jgi:hypothetical protein
MFPVTTTPTRAERKRPCVRCGLASRDGDTYLCRPCLDDPVTHEMADRAVEATSDPRERRVILRGQGWHGGW